jgi:hypothetical protein
MKIIKYENYNTTPLPSEYVRVHCDGINYFFAEIEDIDISSLTDAQILELKSRLNNL